MENDPAVITAEYADKNRFAKKPTNRPAMQIYRPPGLRSGGAPSNPDSPRENTVPTPPRAGRDATATQSQSAREQNTPNGAAGQKPPMQENTQENRAKREENNNRFSSEQPIQNRLNRTESNLSSESALSQKSAASGTASLGSAGNGEITTERKVKKGPSPPKIIPKEKPKKVMSPKEMNDASIALRGLNMANNAAEVEQFIASDFSDDQCAESVGSAMAQHAIEKGSQCAKQVTKTAGMMRDSVAIAGLSRGLLNSIAQYFDCRDRLRQEHFRMWIAFLNFVSDLYSNIGCTPTGELVNVVFQMFDYLLRAPVLESLKIEELESLISALLSIGYELERDCPDQLSALKDLIRDAFIDVTEPWARKMILLLLELGASGWKLPPEANEYYFQQSSS